MHDDSKLVTNLYCNEARGNNINDRSITCDGVMAYLQPKCTEDIRLSSTVLTYYTWSGCLV